MPTLIPIQESGMDSSRPLNFKLLSSLALVLLTTGLAGCYTGPRSTATAPRSAVSRNQAVALATTVATSIGGHVYAIAASGSMIPTLDEGSVVTVEKVGWEKLKKGDIVVYRNVAGIAVIHRLYECHDARWYVLGDNNSSIDRETVSAENLLGRVCAIFYTSAENQGAAQVSGAPPLTAVASAR